MFFVRILCVAFFLFHGTAAQFFVHEGLTDGKGHRNVKSFYPVQVLNLLVEDDLQIGTWENHGGGLNNQRYAEFEFLINPFTVQNLKLKWSVFTNSSVTATPSVQDNVVYAPTWNGFVYATNALTGIVMWKTNLTAVSGIPTPLVICRTTPNIAGNLLILGIYPGGAGAYLVTLNRFNGAFVWKSFLDPHPYAGVTMSGSVFLGDYYVGTTSTEELAPTCCTYQGSFLKVDIVTGQIRWRTAMLPPNGGTNGLYAGAAVWGSSPSVDPVRELVYIATGNAYTTPPNVTACQLKQDNLTHPVIPDPCIESTDHSESVLALDLQTGHIVWANHLGAYDTWVIACYTHSNTGSANCPTIPGDDADFGQEPMLLQDVKFEATSASPCKFQDILVVAQKSGFVYALSADDGSRIWTTVAGPGGLAGGALWGSASDGKTVYVAIANSKNDVYTLLPSSHTTLGGAWVAIDAATGNILWSTPSPDVAGLPVGPVSLANGVLFTTTDSAHGRFYALNATSGNILWTYTGNGSVTGGFSIVNGCAYVGEGLTGLGGVTPGKRFYGFCIW